MAQPDTTRTHVAESLRRIARNFTRLADRIEEFSAAEFATIHRGVVRLLALEAMAATRRRPADVAPTEGAPRG